MKGLIMYTWRVQPPKPNWETRVHGVELGKTPIWWSPKEPFRIEHLDNGDTIVLKIPGGSGWAARWETKYYPTYFQVLKIIRKDVDGNFVCEPVVDFPLRDGKER